MEAATAWKKIGSVQSAKIGCTGSNYDSYIKALISHVTKSIFRQTLYHFLLF